MNIIETERLMLRDWHDNDLEAFTAINQDPKVLAFLPGPWTKEMCQDRMKLFNDLLKEHGFTWWAVELKQTGQLVGAVGLITPPWEAHFTPCVEIGWRLGYQYWGQGYATEAAQAVLRYGFEKCGLKEIVSFTVPKNKASIRVMEKIGMHRDLQGDFYHPRLPADHPLSLHVLYRINIEGL